MYELSQLAVCLLFVLCTIKDVHIYNVKLFKKNLFEFFFYSQETLTVIK